MLSLPGGGATPALPSCTFWFVCSFILKQELALWPRLAWNSRSSRATAQSGSGKWGSEWEESPGIPWRVQAGEGQDSNSGPVSRNMQMLTGVQFAVTSRTCSPGVPRSPFCRDIPEPRTGGQGAERSWLPGAPGHEIKLSPRPQGTPWTLPPALGLLVSCPWAFARAAFPL
jgi:hypothetical protein